MQRNIAEFFFKYDALLRVEGAERNAIAFLRVVVSTTSLWRHKTKAVGGINICLSESCDRTSLKSKRSLNQKLSYSIPTSNLWHQRTQYIFCFSTPVASH
ncbi:hypothetical protein H6F74_27090 [Trichocoleus sp. FACHB-90]|uniref:hypothetical protein n=1 Tax=Cyanophyceae TaxID=3028117 RepID=UPI001682B606|nr:hypothetical protein [Trichocoleus sp. FACHB-90]MBD1929871.1 hypothetical protein [Trichocoleus sp. FACHB-90]